MDPSSSLEADQASGQSSQTKDNIGMEPVYYNAAAKIEIEDIPKPLNLTSPIKKSEDSKSETGEPAQAEVNIGMKAYYYNGAANGKIKVFKDILEPLDQLLTPNRNTVLHIYLTSLKESESKDSKSKYSKSKDSEPKDAELSTAFVEEILEMCPSLLWKANAKDETPLHIAARYGHAAIVDVLIERARAPQEDLENGVNNAAVQKMLEMTNNGKDTALHEAVRNNHPEVVKRLIEKGPNFSYSQNDAGETPLYMAVERGFTEVMVHILDNCTSPAHDGPLGRTTLHAALTWNHGFSGEYTVTDKFLKNNKVRQELSRLMKQADKHGWTPLHYAAYFNCDITDLVKDDRSIAYVKDAKGVTALHIAAHQGFEKIMQNILEYWPDCCELVDEEGWNALHFAMNAYDNGTEKAIQHFLNTSALSNLLNEKDTRGNTPLHCHSKLWKYFENFKPHDRVDLMAFNKQDLDLYDIALASEELSVETYTKIRSIFKRPARFRRLLGDDFKSSRKDYLTKFLQLLNASSNARRNQFVSIMKEASQIHLVVNALIATVTFAAGITMPGGFIGQEGPHPGSAVLTRNTSYRVFVITNTIAMVQSCSAAFIYLFVPLFFDKQNLGNFSFLLASLAFCLSISAMGAMVLAFVTATYAVLMYSLDLAIANCVIGLCFFIPVLFISIQCRKYLTYIYKTGISWVFAGVKRFFHDIWEYCDILCSFCVIIRLLRRTQRRRN